MAIGGSALIVLGVILSFTLAPSTWEVANVNVVGYLLMAAGLLVLMLPGARRRLGAAEQDAAEHPTPPAE